MSKPSRSIHIGRIPGSTGSTKRIGRTIWGAIRQHHLALRQRLAHKAKPPVLEVAQPAMNELGRRGRSTGRKIVLLEEEDGKPTAGCIAGDGRPVDAAADHGQVEIGYRHCVIPKSLRAPRSSAVCSVSDDKPGHRGNSMEYRDRHIIVTGGTGALGSAVVNALVEVGAFCHVPYIDAAEAERSALRAHERVELLGPLELCDESAVATFYAGIPDLWASIHIAGGFAMSPVAQTSKTDLMKQLNMNFVTAFLCCGAAVRSMTQTGAGGRIVNIASRPALEWRSGAGMGAYTASKTAVAALTVALAEEVARLGILVNAVAPSTMDTPANRKAMPHADPAGWAQGRGRSGYHPLSCVAPKPRHPRRDRAGLRIIVSKSRIPIDQRCRHTRIPCRPIAFSRVLNLAQGRLHARGRERDAIWHSRRLTVWCCAYASWFFSISSRS